MSQVRLTARFVAVDGRSRDQVTDGMPQNRKLLAVPFVGKDVPSKASEFSHPDIVIGLTILAYRHEGMRRQDLKRVLLGMREQMAGEAGAYSKRPACQLFVEWVGFAGKRVRGVARSQDPAEVRPTLSCLCACHSRAVPCAAVSCRSRSRPTHESALC